jgi:hypothetical protein
MTHDMREADTILRELVEAERATTACLNGLPGTVTTVELNEAVKVEEAAWAAAFAWADAQKAPQPRTAEPATAPPAALPRELRDEEIAKLANTAIGYDGTGFQEVHSGDLRWFARSVIAADRDLRAAQAEPAPAPADEPPPLPEPAATVTAKCVLYFGDERLYRVVQEPVALTDGATLYTADQMRARDDYWIAKLQAERAKP